MAGRLGITTTTLYVYVNGDGSVKEAGQCLLNQNVWIAYETNPKNLLYIMISIRCDVTWITVQKIEVFIDFRQIML